MLNVIDLNEKENKLVIEKFSQLKSERSKYIARWKDVQDYVAITNNITSAFEDNEGSETKQKDVYINDPTGFICTNQAGDYLAGILWSQNAITLEPTEEVIKQGGEGLDEFYKKATEVTLNQINSTDAGFQTALKSYCYDQVSYGTSGIGTFKSREYEAGQSECCLNFKAYGVHNCCIDEGASNKVNVIYTVYNWSISRIIEEFCFVDGEFNNTYFKELPDEIKNAYNAGNLNLKKKIIYGILPNNYYKMNKRGKNGAKYKGYWFLEGTKKIFKVEYFLELPIAICRYIRVNNQIYGESAGTLAISSIRILNHVKGDAIDNIEKTTDAPLGVFSGALVAGNILNRSAGDITVFNPTASGNQTPIFPISQVGDISAIVNFLLPELKKDIVNIFKIDQLLDFNNQTAMTATESSYRMSIRGKSINGTLSQQKVEGIEPIIHRVISIIQECGLYGKVLDEMPIMTQEDLMIREEAIKNGEVIPDVVAKMMKDNKRWYKVKFNGELEKLCNAEVYEAIGRFLQYFASVLQMKPEIVNAINEYEFLDLLKDVSNLVNNNLVKTKTEYKQIVDALQQAQAQQAQQQAMLTQGALERDMAGANRDNALAQREMAQL